MAHPACQRSFSLKAFAQSKLLANVLLSRRPLGKASDKQQALNERFLAWVSEALQGWFITRDASLGTIMISVYTLCISLD